MIPLFVCIGISTYGQQHYQNTMFWNNLSWINPAASGVDHQHYGVVQGRNQWMGFQGNPKLIGASYDVKLSGINSGIGVNYVYDELGFERNQIVNLNYSYHIEMEGEQTLSVGLSGGINQKRLDAVWITPDHGVGSDPFIPTNGKESTVSSRAGLFYKSDKIWLSGSVTNLIETTFDAWGIDNKRLFFVGGSYEYNVSQSISINPQTMVKTDFASTAIDLNVLAKFKQLYWTGVNYRLSSGDLYLMAGADIMDHFRIGTAYSISNVQLNNNGSLEVVLAAMF